VSSLIAAGEPRKIRVSDEPNGHTIPYNLEFTADAGACAERASAAGLAASQIFRWRALPGSEAHNAHARFAHGLRKRALPEHGRVLGARHRDLHDSWRYLHARMRVLRRAFGKPVGPPDEDEPFRVAEAVAKLGLRYAVVTSVNRDDQPDGGAHIFARTIEEIRRRVPGCKVEVLIPDFRGDWNALDVVLAVRPDILNHNMETVPRLYRQVRKGAVYERSLELLRRSKKAHPEVPTKTGLMLGLGEEKDEVLATMQDLATQGTNILTLGQYLQPTREHLPIVRYVHPDEFAEYKVLGEAMGFKHVEAGPLVRSSYHAFDQAESARS